MGGCVDHNKMMTRTGLQMSVAALLGLITCVALNLWLFRFGVIIGLVGLNLSKHLLIAYLCQVMGVNRRKEHEQKPRQSPLSPSTADGE